MKTCYFLIFTIFSFQFSLQGQNSIPYDRAQPIVNYENYDPIVDTSKLWSVYLQYANILYSMYYKIGDTISLDGYIYYEVLETNEELKSGKRTRITVEDVGGTECSKCHY